MLPGNHNSVVGTEPRWRTDEAAVVAWTHPFNTSSEKFITCHTTGKHLQQNHADWHLN